VRNRRLLAVEQPVIYRSEVEAMLWAIFDGVVLLREIRDLLDGEEETSEE
jgi:hypothetical protein